MASLLDVVERMIDQMEALQASQFWAGIVVWFAFALCAGTLAGARGHNPWVHFAIGLFLSPIVGMLLAAVLTDKKQEAIADLQARLSILEGGNGVAADGGSGGSGGVARSEGAEQVAQPTNWAAIVFFSILLTALVAWFFLSVRPV